MINNEEQLNLEDVIDKKLLQYILTILSSYTGSAAFVMSNTSKELCAINSVNFCDVFRKTEAGAKACEQCDAKHCKEAYNKKKTVLYKCHNDIYTSATPIYDGKNYLGSIMCGQVLFDKPDLEFGKQKAKEYGIDEKEYIETYKQIPIVDEKKFREALAQVENFSNELTNIATAIRRDKRNQQEESIAITLLNAINEKKDISEIISSLMGTVAETLDVDRILIVNYFDGFSLIENDYFAPNKVSDDVIKAIHEAELEEWVKEAWQDEIDTRGLIFFDDIKNSTLDPVLKKLYSGFGLKSALGTIIKTDKEPKAIIVERFNKPHTWTDHEKNFLNILARELSTALKQAKEIKDVEYQLAKTTTLINNMPFEMWMKDLDGKYLTANDVWLKNHHLKKDLVIGKCQEDFFPESSLAEKHKHLYARVLETKEAVVEDIQEEKNWYTFAVYPLVDIDGKLVGFIGSKRDITEQKELDNEKSEFISMVSHELRTPLTSIISGLRLVLSGVIGEISQKAHNALELSERNSQRLLTVINNILDVEKLSENAVEYSNELVSVSEVIEETIKEMEEFVARYNVGVNYKAHTDDSELYLFLDKSRLIQVLSNLLSNAIKFTEDDKDVEIVVNDLPDDKIRISVVNYGIEISEQHRKEIYDNFFKVVSTTSAEQGAGLGLSIAHKLVKDMNGTIDYASRHGKTVFFVEFDKAT